MRLSGGLLKQCRYRSEARKMCVVEEMFQHRVLQCPEDFRLRWAQAKCCMHFISKLSQHG
jgi:hypothetical protein